MKMRGVLAVKSPTVLGRFAPVSGGNKHEEQKSALKKSAPEGRSPGPKFRFEIRYVDERGTG
jgi:hypothetical protein